MYITAPLMMIWMVASNMAAIYHGIHESVLMYYYVDNRFVSMLSAVSCMLIEYLFKY